MIIRDVYIRRWNALFLFSFDKYDKERILDALVWAEAPNSVISQVAENIDAGYLDIGFCFSNPRLRRSVIGVSRTSSGPEFMNTTVHEIFHVAQDISKVEGVEMDSEEFAYLGGDIVSEVSDLVCEMSCPHCNK